jgi:hypothetical protein
MFAVVNMYASGLIITEEQIGGIDEDEGEEVEVETEAES